MLNKVLKKLAQVSGTLCAIAVSNPIQGGLIMVNIFLFRSAMRAFRRARFASTVRVIKDFNTEDLRFLLGQLPPWVTTPDWERGDAVQVLLSILWPAINSTVCSILRRELEERVQESTEFGHIAFSRLSFGRHPPVIVGIKAVPLHGEDLLAMVLDVDVRWAGEPDVVLHLTKLGGASLGLSDVQLAGVIRLVFSPITEDPPFLRRMSVSLLNRPYVDFSVRALGGPDLMSLPAISSWLHTVVLNLADRAIVWPKEVGVPLGPRPSSEEAEEAEAEAATLLPPLGILVVRVISAEIEPRRSTFLGRLKLPSPRIALVLPEAIGWDGKDEGVMQAGLTPVKEKTLHPEFNSQFNFVVSKPSQHLRLLISHKRMELLGADMPLGLADLSIEDIIVDYHRGLAEVHTNSLLDTSLPSIQPTPHPEHVTTTSTAPLNITASSKKHHVSLYDQSEEEPYHLSTVTPSPPSLSFIATAEDTLGYASATSSPRFSSSLSSPARSTSSYVWTSPATSIALPDHSAGAPMGSVRTRSVNWSTHIATASTNASSLLQSPQEVQGLGLLLSSQEQSMKAHRMGLPPVSTHWHPPAQNFTNGDNAFSNTTPNMHGATPCTRDVRNANSNTTNRRIVRTPSAKIKENKEEESVSWLDSDGIWIQVPSSTSMTMAGMVSNATETRDEAVVHGFSRGAQSKTKNNSMAHSDDNKNNASGGNTSHSGWLRSIQNLVMGTEDSSDVLYDDNSDDDEGTRQARLDSAGRVRMVIQWLPVSSCIITPQHAQLQQHGSSGSIANGAGNSNAKDLPVTNPATRRSLDTALLSKQIQSQVVVVNSKAHGGDGNTVAAAVMMGHSNAGADEQGEMGRDRGDVAETPSLAGLSPRPALTSPNQSGVLALRIAYTKLDYGDSPGNPILALSVGANPATSMSSVAAATAAALAPTDRTLCMECQSGGRPGLLHWGRVFHLPVWEATSKRALLELGDAKSSLKLSSYGSELYALDACADFDADVTVDAAASIPLKDVVRRGVVRGTWRLREARARRGNRGGGVEDEHDRLDVGRVALVMAWFPLS